jgi:hypothetical protein
MPSPVNRSIAELLLDSGFGRVGSNDFVFFEDKVLPCEDGLVGKRWSRLIARPTQPFISALRAAFSLEISSAP